MLKCCFNFHTFLSYVVTHFMSNYVILTTNSKHGLALFASVLDKALLDDPFNGRAESWNFGFHSVPCYCLSLLDVLSFPFFLNEKAHPILESSLISFSLFLFFMCAHAYVYVCVCVHARECAHKYREHSVMLVSSSINLHLITEVKFLFEPRTLQFVQSSCVCLTVPWLWTPCSILLGYRGYELQFSNCAASAVSTELFPQPKLFS